MHLQKITDFNIVSTNGGNAANVIAQYNTTEIIADPAQAQDIIDAVADWNRLSTLNLPDRNLLYL